MDGCGHMGTASTNSWNFRKVALLLKVYLNILGRVCPNFVRDAHFFRQVLTLSSLHTNGKAALELVFALAYRTGIVEGLESLKVEISSCPSFPPHKWSFF